MAVDTSCVFSNENSSGSQSSVSPHLFHHKTPTGTCARGLESVGSAALSGHARQNWLGSANPKSQNFELFANCKRDFDVSISRSSLTAIVEAPDDHRRKERRIERALRSQKRELDQLFDDHHNHFSDDPFSGHSKRRRICVVPFGQSDRPPDFKA
jgi:hypothetical protein